MQYWPPGSLVSAQRGAETTGLILVMQHIGHKTLMRLFYVSYR